MPVEIGPTPPDAQAPQVAAADTTLRRVTSALARLRTAARVQLIAQRSGWIIAWILAAALTVGLADYALRLPLVLRCMLWALGACAAGVMLWRRLAPAVRFSPSLTQLALRLERTPAGREAGLEGVLASGLELGQADAPQPALTRVLGGLSSGEAARRFAAMGRASGVLNPVLLRRTLGALLLVAAPVVALSALRPELLRIGTARVLLPWTAAAWPKRTGVVNAAQPVAHAIGAALPLRAIVTRSPQPQGRTDVAVSYRLFVDGKPEPARTALLTFQKPSATFEGLGGEPPASGELYERLLDTASLLPPALRDPSRTIELEWSFQTSDDQTAPWRVLLVEPPQVRHAAAHVQLPGYASSALSAQPEFVRGDHDLGAGSDERSTVGPILAGSAVALTLAINKPLPTPDPADAPALHDWVARVLPGLETAQDLSAAFGDREWTLRFTADRSRRVAIALLDEHGISAADESSFRFDISEDRAAQAAVVDPPQDESVLPSASLTVTGEGRDDVALAWVGLTRQAASPPSDSVGAPPEPLGEPVEIARGTPAGDTRKDLTLIRAGAEMDLSTLGVKPGDEVWLVARTLDLLGASSGREPIASARRRLRIISETELVEQVRAELSGVREAAKRLDTDQARLQANAPADATAAAEQARAQRAISDRLNPMGDVLRRLQQRVERNRLSDSAMRDMLADAQGLLDRAGQSSDEAGRALGRRSDPERAPAEAAQDDRAREQAQAEVREHLESLSNMLDRGQDTWAVRRALEKLLTDQKQTRSQTQAAGQDTQGKPAESLSQEQRADLDRLTRRQREISQQTAAVMEALRTRAQAMQEADAAAAQSMRNAAERARLNQLQEKQEQAAQQISRNQTGSADQLQEQAEQAIAQMMEELEKAEQRRDEQLRRVLADLIQSIEKLIAAQQGELDHLAAAAGAQTTGLDSGMITVHQNTLGLVSKVRGGVRGGEQLSATLAAAGQAQSDAVVAIRATDLAGADGHERTSLTKLNEALEEARKLDDQAEERDAARQRAELRKSYAEALEEQASIAAETSPLLGKEPSRRDRALLRGLGERQAALRARLDELRSKTADLAEAKVFAFVHTRMDEAMGRAAANLGEGQASATIGRDQATALRALQNLVQSLTDAPKSKDFREEENGGDSGGGGGGAGAGGQSKLVPPIAELRLLRAMQAEAADLTRALGDLGPDAPADDARAAAKLQADLASQARELLDRMKQPPADAPAPQPRPKAPQEPAQEPAKEDGEAPR